VPADAVRLAIIGSGAGGGAGVVMIDRGETGGICVNTGCVPSKALLAAAINYLGPCAGVHIYGQQRMAAKLDRVLAALHRQLDAATPADLARGMQ
jgi:pyruvate/2-oxoglutarate dehydrogenase complex dihydrolipoamide dehydrogenase (E3) component